MFRFALLLVMLTSPVLIAQNDDPIMPLFTAARNDIQAGKLDAAQKKLQEAIRLANAEPDFPPFNTSLLYYELGEVFLEKEEFKKAQSAYQTALELRLKSVGTNNISTSNAIDRLGQVYVTDGLYAKAEPLVRRCCARP